MSQGPNKKISATSARAHMRKSKPVLSSGTLTKLLLVVLAGFCAWVYQTAIPPPPKTLGSPDGLFVTSSRIKLRDGRYLAYEESGVPKDIAKSKIIFLHGFGCSKYNNPYVTTASPGVVEELGAHIVSIDRPGYGESDPDPDRTVKSMAFDIEEFADELNLGPKFYVIGDSMGGMIVWSCLKYIPHRLAGAILIAPGINFWWPNLPSNLTNEAFSRQVNQDQWAYRVAHYVPWLSYWWNSQKWFPSFSIIDGSTAILCPSDMQALLKLYGGMVSNQLQMMKSHPTQQGEYESLHRDLNVGFGKWDFDPMDLENPFPNNEGSVHLWMGAEDLIVPVTLQRHIVQQLRWVKYHEVAGAGHLMFNVDGFTDAILRTLLNVKN
ncbi:alpha/Beta hydrolase fold protein [Artemisia annua]|uniref:Alpha/Beta hydrolase fold protein n=1 Tax=Artemisia annua TaxID=35608 RepID=A0A2U1N247_ARTAN|nr:alpha/Beta hydrolase fold protein [Artemisia annua]